MSEYAIDEQDHGRRRGLMFLIVSVVAGLAMSFAAAATVVSTNGPGDGSAINNGQQTLIAPADKLNYGG